MTTTYDSKALLFEDRNIDITSDSTQWIDIKPSTVIDANTEIIEFNVPKNYAYFWDLARSYVEITAKVVKEDGTSIADIEPVGVINNLGHTIFRTQECTINQHQFGSSPNLHHIRCYWENLLGYTSDAKTSYLQAAMFYPDTAGAFHETVITGGGNQGLYDRAFMTRGSKVFKTAAAIHNDLFMQDKWFLSGTEIQLTFYKSPETFSIMCGNANLKPKVELLNATLKLCQVQLTEKAQQTIESQLSAKNIKYPIYETIMQKHVVQPGNTVKIIDNLFPNSTLPEVIVVGFSNAANLNGLYTKSPLEFHHENVSSIGVYLNDVSTPQRPLKLDFANNQCIDGFMSLFTQFNIFGSDKTHKVAYKDYARGYTLYAFNLSSTASSNKENTVPQPRQGVVKIEVNFITAPTEPLYMIIMGKTPRTIELDKTRQIYVK